MLLSELEVGTPITLEIVAGNKKFDVPLKVLKKESSAIYTETFRYGGKVIDFSQKGFEHLMFNVYASDAKSQGRFVWKGVVMQLTQSKGVPYYRLQSKSSLLQGVSINRRGEKRLPMDVPGQAFSTNSGMGASVIISDISSQGISFVTGQGFVMEGEVVDLRFIEDLVDKHFDIATMAQCVRIVPKGNGNVLYGCKIINPSREYQTFVCMKALFEKKFENGEF